MNEDSNHILNWQDKIRRDFGNVSRLYEYLFETMNNFYYRYLETTESKDLKTQELGPKLFGAMSVESSMVEALKIKDKKAHAGILELAKHVPKAQKPMIRLGLMTEVKEMTQDKGHLIIISEIHWDFPEFKDQDKSARKVIHFEYKEFNEYRKQLAQKLEEACDFFS